MNILNEHRENRIDTFVEDALEDKMSKYILSFEVLGHHKYKLKKEIAYYSVRYRKWVVVPEGFISDGATCAMDITTRAWWIHDVLCVTYKYADGSPCSRWQSSRILCDCLWEDGYWIRAYLWFLPTVIAGLF